MSDLRNKRVLMFSPFGSCKHYSDRIADELKRRGAEVRMYDERPSQKALTKIYMNLFRKYTPALFSNYIDKIVTLNKNSNPDYIFIIRGQGFDVNILQKLRLIFPKSKFVYFQWDPINGRKIPEILKLYDAAYSFDKKDVDANPEFKFRPTFYTADYESIGKKKTTDYDYDTVFVGTIYNNRWESLNKIQIYLSQQGFKSYFHLYMASWTLYLWDFVFKGLLVNPKKMKFYMMSYENNISLVEKSKSVLDIVYSKQTGLSMRAYEAMAAKRKYITNNTCVKDYDFYNPHNILIIDKNNPVIPKEFLETPFVEIDENIMSKYSVAGLVDDLFC